MNLPIQKYGKTERRKFGKINEVIDIPDLVEIQKNSYKSFIEEGSRVDSDFTSHDPAGMFQGFLQRNGGEFRFRGFAEGPSGGS